MLLSSRLKIPLTIKIRSGWDENHIVAVDVARPALERDRLAGKAFAHERDVLAYLGDGPIAVLRAVPLAHDHGRRDADTEEHFAVGCE